MGEHRMKTKKNSNSSNNSKDSSEEEEEEEEETESDNLSSESDSDQDNAQKHNCKETIDLVTQHNRNHNKKRAYSHDEDEDGMPLIKKQKTNHCDHSNFSIVTVHDVLAWFYEIGYGEYVGILAPQFEEDSVDGKTLLLLTEDHLK